MRTEYEGYTRNALVQLRRVATGTQIEEDHMRNRQMIVHWLMANTKAIETRERDGKTFLVMVDPTAFREGVGRLLAEVQRIKAEGDYAAAAKLFDTYGIHFDPNVRDEVVARVDALKLHVVHGVRDAEARGGARRRRRDHRRQDLVSAGSVGADARVVREDPRDAHGVPALSGAVTPPPRATSRGSHETRCRPSIPGIVRAFATR